MSAGDVGAVARGLSLGQVKALMRFGSDPVKRPRYGCTPYVRLNQQGLIAWADWSEGTEVITPLGLAVRHHIERENDDQARR
jgi:hypothetical protein